LFWINMKQIYNKKTTLTIQIIKSMVVTK
jgi:hypothetical protein